MTCRADDLANGKDHRVFGVYFFRSWLPSLGSGLQRNRAQAAHFRLGSILGSACRTYHHSSLGTPELSEISLPHPNNYFTIFRSIFIVTSVWAVLRTDRLPKISPFRRS